MSLRKNPRRSVTASKSVREKKISAPIPIKDEDGFPIRTPGSGVATSTLGNEHDATQVQLRNSAFTAPRFAPYRDGSSSQYSAEPLPQSQRSGVSTHEPLPEIEHQQSNTSQVLRRSSAMSRRSVSMRGRPQRKKSSFRTVVGRIFGKKQKGTSISSPIGSSDGPPDTGWAGQHRSVPPVNKSPKGSLYQKRSNSLPINELDRALHSNAINGDQFTIYNGDNATTGGLSDIDGQSRPRRATTPSRLYTPNRTPGYVGWAGLSPRPATVRGSRATPDIVDPESIGYAVTSGSNPHRRSRSLGELQNAALKQGGVVRRRSDEIKYWRESYEPGPLSPLSSNKPDAEDNLIGDNIETPQDEGQVLTPPQPFNFGPLGEMAGMKITEAASLETRVSKLEARFVEMERVVSMNSKLPTKASHILQDPARRRSDNDYSSLRTGLRTESSDFSLPKMKPSVELRPDTADISPCNTRPTSKSTDEPYEVSFQGHPYLDPTAQNLPQIVAPRPLSTSTTVRGHSSSSPTLPILPKDGVITAERYTALVNMILAEQAARRHLENIVENLQAQIRAMQPPGSTPYPQPSPSMRLEDRDFTGFEQNAALIDAEANHQRNEDFQAQSDAKPDFTGEEFGMHLRTGSQEEREAVRTMSLGEITLGKRLQRV
ncbi:hypothetical protein F5884DRAFT_166862 [Xylogone sp. PMI_703]|nr:hypothetical protein F5884DRAFT_166862 [Xylogone sp. PMI_703]